MRARHWVSGGLLLSSAIAGLVQGCGATTTHTSDAGPDTAGDRGGPPVDTGVDSFRPKGEAGRDAAPDAMIEDSTAEACAIDADLETISVPDAALGSSSIGLCLACAKSSCNSDIETCDSDCSCKEALVSLIACVAEGSSFETCALLAATDPNAENLGVCVYSACQVACGIKAAAEGGMDAHGG